MEDLRLIGLSEDGSRLVLETRDGHGFGLRVDERLHAALRGDRARLGQLQITLESQLRPREIQARIRAGATAEEVADAAGVPVERVRRYEGPILLERTHMAQTARAVGVRRVTDATTTPLETVVSVRLQERGVDPEDIDWDSWRRDDARWQVVLHYTAGGTPRTAAWVFDPVRRTLEPADDEARWLTDDERPAPERVRPLHPRLAPVPAPQADEEDDRHDTVPVAGAAEPVPETSGDEVEESQLPARPSAEDTPATPPPHRRERGRSGQRSGRRASVPSWDEILFGGPKSERDGPD